ncbi:MAG: citrate transporter [Firmicutes bacterium]|nr:citrate transporter [Bacillota bacterium]
MSFNKSKVREILQKEKVLVIAAIAAVVSMFFVPPTMAYIDYIDLRVLCLLFSLMAVVAGFQSCHVFEALAQKMLAGEKKLRTIGWVLVALPFFTSMLITNDVALITFVPFTMLVLKMVGAEKEAALIVVLQTVAANLGSMATPFGNPQNLYLYANYNMTGSVFFGTVLPLTLVSLVALWFCGYMVSGHGIQVNFSGKACIHNKVKLGVYVVLFILCLLAVLRIAPYWAVTAMVAIALLVLDRKLLLKVDYALLLTFICFFIFAGNMGEISAVQNFLAGIMEKNTLLTAALSSQVISNVPAAVLLSEFTENGRALLAGVNIGGLGTPIASLASLISLKLYSAEAGTATGGTGRYMKLFVIFNVVGLILLLGFQMMIG